MVAIASDFGPQRPNFAWQVTENPKLQRFGVSAAALPFASHTIELTLVSIACVTEQKVSVPRHIRILLNFR